MSKTKEKTVWFGMKLTPEQKEKIRALARRKGISQKEVVMDLIERETKKEAAKGSFLDGIEHLSGKIVGPDDLSTNPKYMEGFGK